MKSASFIMKIFNFPETAQAIDLDISCDCISSWSVISVATESDVNVASIAIITNKPIYCSSLENDVSVSHNHFDFQGVNIEIKIAIPDNVTKDLEKGFIMTDIDDGYQRCKKVNETTFIYRCEIDGYTLEEMIDVESINKKDAISGFYDSVQDVIDTYGDSANMIIAECAFEKGCQGN